MRDNSYDRTIERNYLQKWRFLIPEYEAVKAGRSEAFRRVGDFYRHHGTCSQTFRKYYNRYLRSGAEADLLPQRRGPKWRERREPEGIEAEIVALSPTRGMNRYEIHAALRERRDTLPSPSTIYRVLKRYHLNRRTPAMREEKRRIIKDKPESWATSICINCRATCSSRHPLPRPMWSSLIDELLQRLAWAEVITSKKCRVTFRTLKMINTLNVTYGLVFAEIMSDTTRRREFASRNNPVKSTPSKPMLLELGIRHRYTRPYRPQTNGKIERFWRTLDDDVIDGQPSTTSITSPMNSSNI